MHTPRRMKMQAALALTALLVGAGCSSVPTGPRPGLDSAFAPDQSSSAPAGLFPTPIPVDVVEASKVIIGSLGGTVRAGNFTVVVPPFAIPGSATVTVTQPDADKPYVQLRISPSSANKFRLPVTLIADATPMESTKLPLAKIVWLNPATGQWVPVQSTSVSLLNTTVSAPLWHFSDYGVQVGGKAGW